MPKLLTAEELKELSKEKVEPHLMSFKRELYLHVNHEVNWELIEYENLTKP